MVMVMLRACAVGAALLVGTACNDGDQGSRDETSASVASTPTTDATSTTASVDLDPDTRAASDFIDAWGRGDVKGMREYAPPDQVDIAIGLGTAEGAPDCSQQPNGQHQCVIDLSTGKRAYLLIGEPGDRAGRVWWIAEYVPGT